MDSIYQEMMRFADTLTPSIQARRRDMHRYPELGWLEVRTASLVAQRLSELGYKVLVGREVIAEQARLGIPDQQTLDRQYERALAQGALQPWAERLKDGFTGVMGVLECGNGPVIGIRCDMDALPIRESEDETHRPSREGFASRNQGWMHACGHDGHTAIGLGTAETLAHFREHLHGTVKLVFQPCEEGLRGACSMCNSGILNDVDYMLGNHMGNDNYQDGTKIRLNLCASMSSTKLDVAFAGLAAHAGAAPERGRNALLAACDAVTGLYAIPRTSLGDTRINVGTLHADGSRNVVCDNARFEMEVRGSTTAANQYMADYAARILENCAKAHLCTCKTESAGYAPSLTNDEPLVLRAKALGDRIGLAVSEPIRGRVGGGCEDYAFMADSVRKHGGQSIFFHTLSKFAGPSHSPSYDIEDAELVSGVKMFSALTMDLMGI